MIEDKLDTNMIEYAVYKLIKTVYTGKVTLGNRPSLSKTELNDFMVVSANGSTESIFAGGTPITGKGLIMVQIWVKSRTDGTKNAKRLTELRKLIVDTLPVIHEGYDISYKGEIGNRDSLGFHSKNINLNINF